MRPSAMRLDHRQCIRILKSLHCGCQFTTKISHSKSFDILNNTHIGLIQNLVAKTYLLSWLGKGHTGTAI